MTPVSRISNADASLRAPDRRLHAILIAALCLITLCVFANALHARFVFWDDDTEIVKNPHIQGLTAPNITWAFSNYQYVRRYQPLDWLSWQLNYQVDGREPMGYHLGNLAEHVTCVILLYFLVLKLLHLAIKPPNPRSPEVTTGAARLFPLAAAAGTLWWAIHPLRVEPVAWVTGRIYTQCTLFLLAAFLSYLYSTASTLSRRQKMALYLVSILAFGCALLSYAIVVGGAVVLLLLDIYPLRRIGAMSPNGWRSIAALRVYAEKIPYFATALSVGIITLWARIHVQGIWAPPPTLAQFPLWSRIMQAFYTLAYYLYANVVPLHLSPVYARLMHFNPNGPLFWASAFTVVVISIFSIKFFRRWPWLPIVWGYHLVMLAPLLGFSEHPHYTNDRYAQMQSLALAVLLAGAVLFAALHAKTFLQRCLPFIAITLLLALWALLSIAQVRVWQTSETLFAHMLAELGDDPYRADIQWRLASVYLEDNRPTEALPLLQSSLHIDPINIHALAILEKTCDLLVKNHESDKRTLYQQVAEAYDHQAAVIQQIAPLRVAAKYYDLAGDPTAAAARLETVISLETDDTQDRLELTRIQHEPTISAPR